MPPAGGQSIDERHGHLAPWQQHAAARYVAFTRRSPSPLLLLTPVVQASCMSQMDARVISW
jgi:hypothetical protein